MSLCFILRFVGTEKHGDSLAGCIFSVVQLVVGSPRCGFRDYILYNGLIGQSPKLALQVIVVDTAAMYFACTSNCLSVNMFTEESLTS